MNQLNLSYYLFRQHKKVLNKLFNQHGIVDFQKTRREAILYKNIWFKWASCDKGELQNSFKEIFINEKA